MHKQVEEKQRIVFIDVALALQLSQCRAKHRYLNIVFIKKFNLRSLISTQLTSLAASHSEFKFFKHFDVSSNNFSPKLR